MRQIAIVAAVLVIALLGLRLAGLTLAGPLAVLLACVAAWWLQRRESDPRIAWGLVRPASLPRVAGWSFAALVAGYVAALLAMGLARGVLGWPGPDTSRIAGLVATPAGLAMMLAIAWSAAAFGEEILFRGFLRTRLQALFGERRGAGAAAVTLQALLFAVSHAYQGGSGILVTGAIGFAFGLVAMRARTLWPVILVHGIMDTLSLVGLHLLALAARAT